MITTNPPRRLSDWGDDAPPDLFELHGRLYIDTTTTFRLLPVVAPAHPSWRPMLATRRYPGRSSGVDDMLVCYTERCDIPAENAADNVIERGSFSLTEARR